MTLLVLILTLALQRFAPGWVGDQRQPKPGFVAVNLAYSFAAAVAGGYITARLSPTNPLLAALALAIVVLVIGAISILQTRDQQPVWYQIALLVLSALGVFAGGLLLLKLWGLL